MNVKGIPSAYLYDDDFYGGMTGGLDVPFAASAIKTGYTFCDLRFAKGVAVGLRPLLFVGGLTLEVPNGVNAIRNGGCGVQNIILILSKNYQ